MTETEWWYRFTKRNFYDGHESFIRGRVFAETLEEAKDKINGVGSEIEVLLTSSLIVKAEVRVDNNKWEEIN